MKGIVLAGGKGTRLYPLTTVLSKQLLPVFDKPMVYYPLSVLMLAGIKQILVISSTDHLDLYKNQLGDGSAYGVQISYKNQDTPRGLADAFIVGKEFIGEDDVMMILGDNIFYGANFGELVNKTVKDFSTGATIFGYYVKNPKPFGVVEFDKSGKVLSVEEKPANPRSNYIIPGLYIYDNRVSEIAMNVEPSDRGEIEITSVNDQYLKIGELHAIKLGRGIAWFDAGTPTGLLQASNFIEAIQNQQGFYVSAIEEIAFRKGFISKEQYLKLAEGQKNSPYGQYLLDIVDEIEDEKRSQGKF